MLRAPGDGRGDALTRQFPFERFLNLVDEALALDSLFLQQARDLRVGIGVEKAEREVLKFPLELPHAQSVRQCGVYFTRFECQRPLRFPRRRLGGSQSEQLFGNAYQHQAHVGDDGQQHLAQRLGLLHRQRFSRLPVLWQRELMQMLQAYNKSRNIK